MNLKRLKIIVWFILVYWVGNKSHLQVKFPNELKWIDIFVNRAIKEKKCPGAVILCGVNGKRVYFKAFGFKALIPEREPMTKDTIFDLASVTKPVACALSVMKLWEKGKLSLDDKVCRYFPEFKGKGKENITIKHLLTHHSGLLPDNPLKDYKKGWEEAWKKICSLPLLAKPGERFIYSDVGFIILGKLVEKISGRSLSEFAKENIFKPLGMNHTFFNPPKKFYNRIAPTQLVNGIVLRGVVHDPRARFLGGVAGHAGLFSTAADLEKICLMMLGFGKYKEKRIYNRNTILKMITLPKDGSTHGRGLGWDIASNYSSPRGMWLTKGVSFGHSGFTGTSIWIDPKTKAYVIFLSNRVHPNGRGNVIKLRRMVGSFFGRALGLHLKGVIPGIEMLMIDELKPLLGSRIGLITNHTGITRDGISDIDVFFYSKGVKLVCLFSPEHGIRGKEEKFVDNSLDKKTGLPIFSLYGKTRRPTQDMLKGIDTLVFDIQDIGTRFYTYISTMLYSMEEADKAGKRFFVLDRPNPIGGVNIFGPLPDDDSISFTACAKIPVVHGMTIGELAILFKKMKKMRINLNVIKMSGWKREMFLDQTGIPWINPSPNMTSLEGAILYPAIGLLEATNISVGRGTKYPFRIFGAPWINNELLLSKLRGLGYKSLEFKKFAFIPAKSKYAGKKCKGIMIKILERKGFDPVCLGLEIGRILLKIHPNKFEFDKLNALLKSKEVIRMLKEGKSIKEIKDSWQKALSLFKKERERCLLYE